MGKSSSNDELTIRNQFDRICNLVRSTVYEHRKRSLELMKEMMEEYQNEQEK